MSTPRIIVEYSKSKRPPMAAWAALLSLIVLGFVMPGCGGGCQNEGADSADPKESQEEQALQTPLGDELVAVARLLRFNERHFDLRYWRTLATEQGLLDGTDAPVELVGKMPTAEFRLFAEELLEEQANLLRWDGHLDVAIWRPEEEGQPWRWAVSLPRNQGEPLEEAVDWVGEGFYYSAPEEGGERVTVFERAIERNGEEATYYIGEVDVPEAVQGTYDDRAITISNFPQGAARLPHAVDQTGESGTGDAELYVWPRRWGIADRYAGAAEMMEQHLSLHGHDLMPARVGLLQLQAQIFRALGNAQAWPDVMRLTFRTDRASNREMGGQTVARRAEMALDLPSDQGRLFPALWSAMRESNLRNGPRAEGAVGKLGLSLRPREIADLADAVLPKPWLQLFSVRGAGTRDLLIQGFEQMLLHNRGPTTVAFYPKTVPPGMTGEVFVGWRALDRQELMRVSSQFHTRLMRDYWMPLFDQNQFARRGTFEGTLGDDEVTFNVMTFALGHGFGEVGVCWTARGQEYLSYYGVAPCERLQEVADFEEENSAAPALSYNGNLQSLVNKLYVLPGETMHDAFGDLEVSLGVSRFSQGRLTMTTTFPNPAEIAVLADGIPQLARYWGESAAFDPTEQILELGLDQATYQEPALMTLGVPGMGGVLPASFLLGMPFSFPPTPPTLFREIYFGSPSDSGDGHDHGSHRH